MDFEFNEDQLMLQQQMREFATEVVDPGAEERDETASLSDEYVQQLAELGVFGITIPEEHGGAGMGTIESSIVVEEMSKACAGTGVLISAHGSLCVDPIMTFGTDEQKAKYLPVDGDGRDGSAACHSRSRTAAVTQGRPPARRC